MTENDTKQAEAEEILGSRVRRREDPALITGRAKYTDDLSKPGMLYATIIRSPHAHARILEIDTDNAKAMDEVIDVFTAQDLEEAGVPGNLPVGWYLPSLKDPPHPIMAREKVRYVGDAVAVVVAKSRYGSQDASEAVDVSYEKLPEVVELTEAHDHEGSVHEDVPDNVSFDWEIGTDEQELEEQFRTADRTLSVDMVNQRLVPNAIEPRATLADYESSTGKLTVHMTTQNPHLHRQLMSGVLNIPEQKIQVVAPEVGGGFGSKIHHYPDEAITSWCALQLDRPVKWTAKRSESFITDAHGRDHVSETEIAFNEDGDIRAVRVKTIANTGAYHSTFGPAIPSYLYATLLSGQYEIPSISCNVIGTFTNTVPTDAYRGAGRPEACYVVERLIAHVARELNLDPADVRRKNFIGSDQFPYESPVGVVYDSGDYQTTFEKALENAEYDDLRSRQKDLRKEGRYLGIGTSCYIEACGLAPSKLAGELGAQAGLWESGLVRFHPTGKVTAFSGTSGHGQGHATSYAQIVSDRLGVPYEDVEVVEGDTDQIPHGMGTYGSRSAAVGGSSLAMSCEKIVKKAQRLAPHQLEVSEEDLVFEEGEFHVQGAPSRSMTIQEVAGQAYLAHNIPEDMEPGLEETTFYDPENFTFPFGTYIAVVEVDPDTGDVDLKTMYCVDDVGNQINPMIVEGQIHGGLVQGIGQALYEGAQFDDQGNLVTGSMQDYTVPRAFQVPDFHTDSTVTPSPHNPLGVKGVGEAGTIGAPPAVVNAVLDALEPFGVDTIDMPMTPRKVWHAIHDNGEGVPG